MCEIASSSAAERTLPVRLKASKALTVISGPDILTAAALEEYTAKTARKRLGYVVEPQRVISWDHRKLAPPPGG